MKSTSLLSKGKPYFAIACVSLLAQAAQASVILQFDNEDPDILANNSGVGSLEALNVDPAFVSSNLSFIGNDGTTVQGVGSVASFPGGVVPTTATTVNGGVNQTNTSSFGGGQDVVFNINPAGPLSGTTTASLAGGNFIFFTFTAAQAFQLGVISAISDPNNGSVNFGSRTAGAFVSLDGGATFAQFGTDVAQNNNAPRTNTFTDSLAVASGDNVEVRLAFTNEVGGSGFQQATRIGSISVEAIPEPTSGFLLLFSFFGFCLRRRRH